MNYTWNQIFKNVYVIKKNTFLGIYDFFDSWQQYDHICPTSQHVNPRRLVPLKYILHCYRYILGFFVLVGTTWHISENHSIVFNGWTYP